MEQNKKKTLYGKIIKRVGKSVALFAALIGSGSAAAQTADQQPSNRFDTEFNRPMETRGNQGSFVPPRQSVPQVSGQANGSRAISLNQTQTPKTGPSLQANQARTNSGFDRFQSSDNQRKPSINASAADAKVFRSYNIESGDLGGVAATLQQKMGRLIDVVQDDRNQRLLISSTVANHRMVEELLKNPTRTEAKETKKVAAKKDHRIRSIRSFNVESKRIRKAADEVSQLYTDKNRVIVAADEVVGKLMVFSTETDYQEISRYLDSKGYVAVRRQQVEKGAPQKKVHALKNMGWRDLENTLLATWGNAVRLETSTDGSMSRLQLPKSHGAGATIMVDRKTNQVQIESVGRKLNGLIQVIAALDEKPSKEKVKIVKTSSMAIDQVQTTISMFKFAALQETQPKITSAIIGKGNKKSGIYAIYQDDQDENTQQNQDDTLAPLSRVEIIQVPGTDLLLLRGEPDDVERVRKLIAKIETTSEDYQPQIEVVPLQHVDNIAVQVIVDEVYTAFFEPQFGDTTITALVKPNALLLVGPPDGVKQVRDIITKLDVDVTSSTEFKVFRIKNMSAVDLENRLRGFYLGQNTGGIGANAGGGNQTGQGGGFQGEGLAARLRLASDYRSNTLFVHAAPRDMTEITKFIAEIDVEAPLDGAVDIVKTIRLKNSVATELAPVLQEVLNGQLQGAAQSSVGGQNNQFNQFNQNNQGFSQVRAAMLALQSIDPSGKMVQSSILFDVRVTADDNSNSLIIRAPRGSMELIELLIAQLDKLPEVESRIKVFELQNASAPQIVETIQNFFDATQAGGGGGAGGAGGGTSNIPLETGGYDNTIVSLRLAADSRSNTVIAAGSAGDLKIIDALVARLDEDIESDYEHRVYRLQNVTAETVQEAISGWLEGRTAILEGDPRVVGSGDGSLETVKRAISVQAETETNSLIVTAHKDYLPIVDQIIRDIDFKKQIVIQAAIANIQLNDNFELGIEWGVQDSLLFDRGLGGTTTVGFPFNSTALGNDFSAGSLGRASREDFAGQVLSNLSVGRSNTDLSFGGLVVSAGNESINVLLRALQAKTKVDILQRPQITTMENIQAFIQVGQDVPYITGVDGDATAGGTTSFGTDFLELGVTLAVTPRVRPDGEIWMRVDVSNSSVADQAGVVVATTADGGVVTQPIINDQTLQTDITAQSGQTVILGGLIQKTTSTTVRGLPFFSDLPGVGRLFRFDQNSDTRSELVVILRPIVIDSPEDREVLKQLELARINWCLSDVVDIYGPVYEDETLAGDTDTVYPDRTPTQSHHEANLQNRNGGLGSGSSDESDNGGLAPLNESAFRSFDAPLPNADRFPASKNRFATQVSSQGNKREKRASNASFQGKPSAVKRTEAKPEKKKKKGFLSIPNIFKKKNTEK